MSYKEIKLKKAKGSSGRAEIFEAINTLIKATKHDLKLHSSAIYAGVELAKRSHKEGRFEIMIFLPILVFGGELYTWINGDVDEKDKVLVEGRCHTRRYFESMLIEVVKESHVREFLSRIDEECTELSYWICWNRRKLDEQAKAIMESPYFDGHPSLRGRL